MNLSGVTTGLTAIDRDGNGVMDDTEIEKRFTCGYMKTEYTVRFANPATLNPATDQGRSD